MKSDQQELADPVRRLLVEWCDLGSVDVIPLGSDPPWFEHGTVREISPSTWEFFRDLATPWWSDGERFIFGDGTFPARVFWRENGRCYAHQLTREETDRLPNVVITERLVAPARVARSSRPKSIRLACALCDIDDFDGVDRIPEDWIDVSEIRTWEASRQPVTLSSNERSVYDWYTHLGICPQCQAARDYIE